ncbi:MAG: translation elongation factor Ts [bacterium]
MSAGASDVKTLREKTGAGILDCKNALDEVDGDIDEAADYLRRKGLEAAQAKSAQTAEGKVGTHILENNQIGVLVEVNCQTDFVANTDAFGEFVEAVAKHIAVENPSGNNELIEQPYTEGSDKTIQELLNETVAEVDENINIQWFVRYEVDQNEAGKIGTYIHMGGNIGVIVEVTAEDSSVDDSDELGKFVNEVAMQIAAQNPRYISRKDVPENVLEEEKGVIKDQVDDIEEKPEDVQEQILEGKLESDFFQEEVLLEQTYIRDTDLTIEELLKEVVAEIDENVNIRRFERFEVGEGVEVEEEDFAEEVAEEIG